MGLFTYHGIVAKDYQGKIIKKLELENLDYFIRNQKYWFEECYWSVVNPIAPSELGLPELDDGHYYHFIETSSTY